MLSTQHLPGHHPFLRLITIHEQQKAFSRGPQAMLATVRQNYWLILMRDVASDHTQLYYLFSKLTLDGLNTHRQATTI